MRMLGIVGGLGPESTIAYYRLCVAEYREITGQDAYPPILINSIDMRRALDLVTAGDPETLAAYLLDALAVLARAGADLGLLSANTPHIVFDDVRARSPLPLVSIVESTCQAASALHLTRVGLLGTRFTMQARFYPDVFSRAGIELVVPQPDEQRYVHDKYVTELVNGTVLSDTHDGLVRIIQSLRERDGAEAVILAGTELPLILTEAIVAGIPLLDTARIHVHAAAERLWR